MSLLHFTDWDELYGSGFNFIHLKINKYFHDLLLKKIEYHNGKLDILVKYFKIIIWDAVINKHGWQRGKCLKASS